MTYIRQDIEVPYQIYGLQQEAIMHHGLAPVMSLEQRALPAIAAMEMRGIGVDVERWRHILVAKRQQKADLEEQIKQTLGKVMFLRILFAFLSDNFSRGLFQAA